MIRHNALVAGVDEAGRGPLAGPVVAAAVILRPDLAIDGLRDSKQLAATRRDALAREIRSKALCWSVAWADRAEIDALNILAATMLAMRRAVLGLAVTPAGIQVDGNRLPNVRVSGRRVDGEAIVGGDASVPAISAASIIAKTVRDQIMVEMDSLYPLYEFARHKGYGTEIHRERLREHGPCREHRTSFAPVRALL
ncbi:MAG: ribonuclease HII [Proteobacteria bacterium]|nr:ribonuclease HII [Pseudomonadota bacterium]MCH7833845.1 ribonuclease HII [Pseudomonadota bacterium]MCH8117107.1 ribonuclease HII [Pseudomonadota bacterium]